MVFTRFVEVGRVVQITYGPYANKYAVIVDVIDQARALVDGPASGVPRHALSYRRLRVTDYKIDITRAVETGALLKIIEKIGFQKTWAASPFAKALEVRTKRSNMSDFDRFKVMLLKKQRAVIVNREVNKLKRSQ